MGDLRVIGTEALAAAKKKHAELDGPLSSWLKIAETSMWTCLNDIRKTWPSTDGVEGKIVFNIKGNNYRLIATINFRSQLLFINHVMSHEDYSRGGWK